jgi:thiol:disulfide interchange protein DsbD
MKKSELCRNSPENYRGVLIGLLTALFILPITIYGQSSTTPDARAQVHPVEIEAYSSHARIAPGQPLTLAIKLSIDPGWHVNSNRPNEDFLIPTEVTFAEEMQFEIDKIRYPDGKSVRLDFSPDMPLSVYDDIVWFSVILKARENVGPGPVTIPLQLTAQACDDRSCIAPVTHELPILVQIVSSAAESVSKNHALFESLDAKFGADPAESSRIDTTIVPTGAATDQSFWTMLRNFDADIFVGRFGYILAFIAMYILGLGLTLTPCVYPIIPITIGYFGSQSSGKMARQFLMAMVFGVGIAISYAAVGTAAALSGSLMGAALQNPAVLVGLATLCFVMGLNAFGVFEITLPGWLLGMTSGGSRKGIAGAAIMGLTMGIAAAPCLAAFIVSLLAFVGQKGDLLLGFSMFFILGLGLATPFVALGTFSGLISKVPKSGAWMVFAKKVMGALLFAATLYFLNPILPKLLHQSFVVVALVAAGLYFGFFENTPARTWLFKSIRLFLAIVFIGGAIWYNTPAELAAESGTGITWLKYSDAALSQARTNRQPVIIDFYADWCIPCKELDKFSFSDKRVIETSRGIVMLKADLTKGNSPEVKKMTADFEIRGVPTIVFINAAGEEIRELRINQFEKSDVVLSRFNRLLQSSTALSAPAAGSADFRR